jgi:hypothetical protein
MLKLLNVFFIMSIKCNTGIAAVLANNRNMYKRSHETRIITKKNGNCLGLPSGFFVFMVMEKDRSLLSCQKKVEHS